MPKVSVCMATYNGAAYLSEQIDSILSELSADDEVIVVDDCSSDNTVGLIEAYGDARIRIFRNDANMGAVRTFEKAIGLSSGDYVFLSDQDDVWLPGRLSVMRAALDDNKAALVVSNYAEIDGEGRSVERADILPPLQSTEMLTNGQKRWEIMRGKINYFGCAMGFTRSFGQKAVPFPAGIECHDLWLAALAIEADAIGHVEANTLKRRLHGSNLSLRKRPLWKKLRTRVGFIRMFIAARRRNRNSATIC